VTKVKQLEKDLKEAAERIDSLLEREMEIILNKHDALLLRLTEGFSSRSFIESRIHRKMRLIQ